MQINVTNHTKVNLKATWKDHIHKECVRNLSFYVRARHKTWSHRASRPPQQHAYIRTYVHKHLNIALKSNYSFAWESWLRVHRLVYILCCLLLESNGIIALHSVLCSLCFVLCALYSHHGMLCYVSILYGQPPNKFIHVGLHSELFY